MSKCACSTKSGKCENDAVEVLQIPIPSNEVVDANGNHPTEAVYATLPVCADHRDEARHDFRIDEMH
jgi:hypothetical protein